jgi:glycosyltransferase involved in cell wall biosynthesis/tetratricopeptide (TPR) repeat protein
MGALALYDGLPRDLREHPDILQQRGDILERLCRQAETEARRLRRGGDLMGALAIYDGLPLELRELSEIRRGRDGVVDRLLSQSTREGRRLRRAGNVSGALAVYHDLPLALRERAEILQERARLLHLLGRLKDAHDMFRKALAADPAQKESWQSLGAILTDLGHADELQAVIVDMVSALPAEFETLVQAAQIAKAGKLSHLADELLDRAMSVRATASAEAILKAAQILLKHGEQGRVINLLNSEPVLSDVGVRGLAADLGGIALAQLRLAGRSSVSGPVGETERADVIGVRSVLAQDRGLLAVTAGPAPRGIAIVVSSLGAGGAQKQVVELVRQICSSPCEHLGAVFLLLVSRSSSEPEFHASKLAGLGVTTEFMSDFDFDVEGLVPAGVAAKLGALSPNNFNQTVWLVDRLKALGPQAVLVMSDLIGLPAMLAASLVGVPRVVISARNVPPPTRRQSDSLLRPAYQAALARDRISLVTNSSATAQAFVEWLGKPSARVGVIYNGVDVDGLVSQRDPAVTAAHRRALDIPDGARVVGSIFQARRQKRPRLWIDAAAIVAQRAPDVAFVLVGDKLQRDDVSATLAQCGLQGRLHRPGIRNDVANWLDLMDVVLLTSETEGTPNVLLEAQALGRPVVATAVGGTAESFMPGVTGGVARP